MQNQFSLTATPVRLSPPAHVKRWTGRVLPTILLPDLATLRMSTPSSRSSATR